MSTTRADLLAAAAASAGAAKAATDHVSRLEHAAAAKTALEAAALAEGMPPDEIAAILNEMSELLAEVGLDKAWSNMEPGPFLEYAFSALRAWRDLVAERDALKNAHDRLHTLATALERDFTAGDSETSLRIAARIHTALEEADEMLGNERQED